MRPVQRGAPPQPPQPGRLAGVARGPDDPVGVADAHPPPVDDALDTAAEVLDRGVRQRSARARATGPRVTTAPARTCGETWSRLAASRRSVAASGAPGAGGVATTRSRSVGRPRVSVPVLSSSRIRPAASRSRAAPPLTTTPSRAAWDSPEMIAIGAASSSGHGVATTRTATARTGSPDSSQAPPAITSVSGTNATATRSAGRTNGALAALACSTSRTMPAYVDSAAAAVATSSIGDPALTAPLRTSSPADVLDGERLTRERRLVEGRGGDRAPVDGDDLTGSDEQDVTTPDDVDAHLDERAAAAVRGRAGGRSGACGRRAGSARAGHGPGPAPREGVRWRASRR